MSRLNQLRFNGLLMIIDVATMRLQRLPFHFAGLLRAIRGSD